MRQLNFGISTNLNERLNIAFAFQDILTENQHFSEKNVYFAGNMVTYVFYRSFRKFSRSICACLSFCQIIYLCGNLIWHIKSHWQFVPIALALQEIWTEKWHFSEKKLLFCRKYSHVRVASILYEFLPSIIVYIFVTLSVYATI
jgi:hypothetical protein